MTDVVDSDERVFAALVAKNPNGAVRSDAAHITLLLHASAYQTHDRSSAFGLAIVGSAGAASVATASETLQWCSIAP